jgi:hypothetical protein
MITRIKSFILGLFVKRPNVPLHWTYEDFQRAKAWAKTQPHPSNPKLTYWDYIYSYRVDSVDVLMQVNQYLHVKPTGEIEEEPYTFI